MIWCTDRLIGAATGAAAAIVMLTTLAVSLDHPALSARTSIEGAVAVRALRCGQPIFGSGVVLEARTGPVVVTAAHVIVDGEEIEVVDQAGDAHDVVVVASDSGRDLAALRIDGFAVDPEPLGYAPGAIGGVAAVGENGSVDLVPFEIVRRVQTNVRDVPSGLQARRRALELAVELGDGDSGAAAVSTHGEVVGIVWAVSEDRDRTAWAVDSSEVAAFLDELPSEPRPVIDPGACL